MNNPAQALLLCDSIHDVLLAERVLKDAKLWCDLVPVPRELASDCGMALVVQATDLESAQAHVAQAQVRINAWFERSETSYIPR